MHIANRFAIDEGETPMQIAGAGALSSASTAGQTTFAPAVTPATTSAGSDNADSPETTLLAYFRMTPAQKMRFDIMSQMGIAQEDYNNMTPKQKAVVDAKIKEKMKEEVQQMAEKKTGLIVDFKA